MPRVKRSSSRRLNRSKVLKLASGYRGARGRLYRIARLQVEKSLQYAYRDRKARKRDFRRLWIIRINAAARLHDLSYSRLMHGLELAGIALDRKVLADIAVKDAGGFATLASQAKRALEQAA